MSSAAIVAVDIGNSRVKLTKFVQSAREDVARGDFPHPEITRQVRIDPLQFDSAVADIAAAISSLKLTVQEMWAISSVSRPVADRLAVLLDDREITQVKWLTAADVTIPILVDEPLMVGIDRLMAAMAVHHLKSEQSLGIAVDIGTAITVDLVERDGSFVGGAILPGIAMGAAALAERTDALPCSPLEELHAPPSVIGKNTLAALEAGLYWGAVGGIKEIIRRMVPAEAPAEVFLTGGASAALQPCFANDGLKARHVPHLVEGGIVLTMLKSVG